MRTVWREPTSLVSIDGQAEETDFEEGILLHEIGQIRAKLPGIGTEKLHFELEEQGIYRRWSLKMGRDKLADLLARHGLLVVKKRTRVRTTNSMHNYRKHPNLAKDVVLTEPNQLWVCDIRTWPSAADTAICR